MKNLLKSEAYYFRKDSTTKGISLLFLLASIALTFYVGTKDSYSMSNPVEPLSQITQLSFFFYFIIPIHACFFNTEGFEYGSIKNIIAAGQSRNSYVLGKLFSEILLIVLWLLLFFGIYYILYLIAAWITGSSIGMNGLSSDLSNTLIVLSFNVLYLTAYVTVVQLACLAVRKAAMASILTFAFIFGDFLVSGYLKSSSSSILRTLSNSTMTTQIMKFSGIYSANGQHIVFARMNDYLQAILIPTLIILISLSTSLILFNRRDIRA